MSTAEVPIRVTREMIEAHYKSIMNTARILLSQGDTAHAQDLLSDACRLPYPSPAPASMPEAAGRETLGTWSTEEVELLVDYFHNWTPQAPRAQTTAQTARLIADALNNLIAKSTGGHTP